MEDLGCLAVSDRGSKPRLWTGRGGNSSDSEYNTDAQATVPTHTMPRTVSWNVKGFRSPQKRTMVLRHLKKLKTDIALLQETHLRKEDFEIIRRLWVGEVVGSEGRGRKAGVLILIRKNVKINIS